MFVALLYMLWSAYLVYGLLENAHFGFAVVFMGVTYLLWSVFRTGRHALRESREFIDWLSVNLENLEEGTARYKGQLVKPDTELVSYSLCMSFFLFTSNESTGYMIQNGLAKKTQILFTVSSLLFGWWGLPWGPIWSCSAIGNNTFPEKKKVSELIDDAVAAAMEEEKNLKASRKKQKPCFAD